MKLKVIKTPYDKKKLYKLALREALIQLTMLGDYKTVAEARLKIMNSAKNKYRH